MGFLFWQCCFPQSYRPPVAWFEAPKTCFATSAYFPLLSLPILRAPVATSCCNFSRYNIYIDFNIYFSPSSHSDPFFWYLYLDKALGDLFRPQIGALKLGLFRFSIFVCWIIGQSSHKVRSIMCVLTPLSYQSYFLISLLFFGGSACFYS